MATSSIHKCVDLLLERDYPEIVIFDGSRDNAVGPIFIPEGYLPKKPKVVDLEMADDIMEQFPNDKKLIGDIRQTKGDMLERQVYNALKKHFSTRLNEDVLVIQGLELVKLGGVSGGDKQEVDFLIVNFTHQYILNIEVKKWHGQIQGKSENIIDKAKDQQESIKAIIEDWFGADLKGNWRYVSALFCQDMEEILKNCHHCKKLIAANSDQISAIMASLEKNLALQRYPEDFKTLCKYLLFSRNGTRINLVTSV